MVLPKKDEEQDAGFMMNKFNTYAKKDVEKFFFVHENVSVRGRSDEEKGADLSCYLEGDVFDFYTDSFAEDGLLVDAGKKYSTVKSALVDQFATLEEPEDNVCCAIAARLDHQDLIGSMRMDRCFAKARFNFEAKFGLLRNAVMQFPDLAQFATHRVATIYDALKTTVKNFVAGRTVFFSSRNAEIPEQANAASGDPKNIVKRPDVLERKVDILIQLAELSLLVKRKQNEGVFPVLEVRAPIVRGLAMGPFVASTPTVTLSPLWQVRSLGVYVLDEAGT